MKQLQQVAVLVLTLIAGMIMVAPVASADDSPLRHKVVQLETHKKGAKPGQAREFKYAHEAQCKDSLRGIGAYADDDVHIWGVNHGARSFYGYGSVYHDADGQVNVRTGFIMAGGYLYWTWGHCRVDYSNSDWID